jgi:mono/diheme cytochrome c family protein
MHLRPRLVATQLLLLSCALFGVAMQPNVAPVQGQDGGDEPVKDGKWFYTRNCSGCHNDNGDGHGATIVALGLTARDFKQGGFAFGDSREAITRTINTGIPGRSPMPSFRGILKDEEIGLVVDYVRTLMPPRKDEAPKNTEMIVKDRPVIARGKLPPLVEGGADIPRGLLIGTPEGMTFEYDVSDVKLLGVRLGGFADREDWSDRGGAYLKPLGQLVFQSDDDLEPFFGAVSPLGPLEELESLTSVLESTSIKHGRVTVTYALRSRSTSRVINRCHETLRTDVLSIGPGFTRTILFETDSANIGFDGGSFWRIIVPIAGSTSGQWRLASHAGDPPARWWLRDRSDKGVDAVLIRSTVAASIRTVKQKSGPLEFQLDFDSSVANKPVQLTASTVTVTKWSTELGDQLVKELGQ